MSSWQEEVSEKLSRHLGLFDLLALGVGGTVGSGVFVLAGAIAYDDEHPAGPSVVLSFLISVSILHQWQGVSGKISPRLGL